MQVPFLGWKDSLEEEMVTHSSILAWKITWTEESGGLQSLGSQRVEHEHTRRPGLESRVCHLLAVPPSSTYLTSLILFFCL